MNSSLDDYAVGRSPDKKNTASKKRYSIKDIFIYREKSALQRFDLSRIKNIKDNRYCSGCTACLSVCKQSAIKIKEDKDGFIRAFVDTSKCNNCGRCNKICPVINFSYTQGKKNTEILAVQAEDELRQISSSGGVFSLLATLVIENGGVVCGARFSDNYESVEHCIISDLKELDDLRLSKYVQSDLKDTFVRLKEFLEKGCFALFTGTSCQVAGLLSYLGKDYPNLITIDLVCNGAPSRKVYRKYLSECIKTQDDEVITDFKFRLKDQGWYSRAIKVETNSNSFRIFNSKSIYQQAFFRGLSIGKLCEICPFETLSRPSDITLGDFWGIKDFAPNLDDDKGTSYLAINTKKGKEAVLKILPKCKLVEEASFDWAIKYNTNILNPISHHNRNQFFFNLDKMSLNDNYNRCIRDQADCIIFNHAITEFNYGSVLTAYAIQELICQRGFFAKILNTQRVPLYRYKESFGYRFARDYLNLTDPTQSDDEFIRLNAKTNVFLVGSDQVWRPKYWKVDLNRVLLNFVESDKFKIAIAASFGTNEFEGSKEENAYFKKETKKFNLITVREKSGVDICRNEFSVDATWILDPVFILEKEKYERIAKESDYDCSDRVVYYGWDFTNSRKDLTYIQNCVGAKALADITGKDILVEDWLHAIQTAKFFVSNSYHGICFAMIFHKPFICVNDIGEARFDSLDYLFDLKNHMVSNISEIRERPELLKPIDYSRIDKILDKSIKFSSGIIDDIVKIYFKSYQRS